MRSRQWQRPSRSARPREPQVARSRIRNRARDPDRTPLTPENRQESSDNLAISGIGLGTPRKMVFERANRLQNMTITRTWEGQSGLRTADQRASAETAAVGWLARS